MKRNILKLIGGLGALIAASALAQTQTTTTQQTGSSDQWINQIKNPTDWMSWGGDLRVRNEYYNDALSLTKETPLSPLFAPVHEQDYFRFRGRVWVSLFPTNDLTINARMAAEPRDFLDRSTFDTYFGRTGMQWRYGIIDSMNVRWKNPAGLPATVTVGRQDIFLGDGWLVGDGTPEDGSFTSFLDAFRATVKLDEQKTTIDMIGLVQYARPDAWLPTIGPSTTQGANPEPLLLTDQNEKGAILWVANKSLEALNVDAYFMYKHDTRINDFPTASFGDNGDIYTLGGRLSGTLQDHWKYSVEGAYQLGSKQDPELNGQGPLAGNNPLLSPSAQTTGYRDIEAFGINSKITYLCEDKKNDQFSLNFEYLSGDDSNSKNDEMFDVMWGRWPSWSEMYNIYSYVQETRVGQTANLIRVGPTWTRNPSKNSELSVSYSALFADQDVPTRNMNETFLPALGLPQFAGPFSNSGNFRGHYVQAILRYKFSAHMTGHLWSEFLFPGDFYASHQTMSFFRAELMYTF